MKRILFFGAVAVVPLACLSSLDERDLDKGGEAGESGASTGGSGNAAGTGGSGESGESGEGSGNAGRGGSGASGKGGTTGQGGSGGSAAQGGSGNTNQGGESGMDGSGGTSGSAGAGGTDNGGSAGAGGVAAGGGTGGSMAGSGGVAAGSGTGGFSAGSGTGGTAGAEPDACAGDRENILAPRDEVSMGSVIVVSGTTDRVVYVDASAGGLANAANNSWTYLALATATRVDMGDTEAATSVAWDVAFKREGVRLNGGDSGPGRASAARLANRSYASVMLADLSNATFATDNWMSDDCVASLDTLGKPITAFSPWYLYDESTMRLEPALDTFLVKDAAGNVVYRFEFQSYYSTETGADGGSGARYRIRYEALAAES